MGTGKQHAKKKDTRLAWSDLPGPGTRKVLSELTAGYFEEVEKDEATWQLDWNGSQRCIFLIDRMGEYVMIPITEEAGQELDAVWRFENHLRFAGRKQRAGLFKRGDQGNWLGIRPYIHQHVARSVHDEWRGLATEYRDAALALAHSPPNAYFAEPLLFLCRHALELQLKGLILVGQEVIDVSAVLDPTHKLTSLWPLAAPHVALFEERRGGFSDADRKVVLTVINELSAVDDGGDAFRYPVKKNAWTTPRPRSSHLYCFDKQEFLRQFVKAFGLLDRVLGAQSSKKFSKWFSETLTETSDPSR